LNTIFHHLRIRNLLIWMVISGLIFLIISASIFLTSEYLGSLLLSLTTTTMFTFWLCLYITPVLWLLIKLKKNHFTFNVFFRSNRTVSIGNIIALTFMLYIFIHGMAYLWEGIKTWSIGLTEPAVLPPGTSNGLLKILSIITFVLIAPICEEIIFRGILLGRLTAKYNLNIGIISSSFVFGFLHTDFVSFTLFGILLSLLFIKSNSLMGPIIVHISFNTTSVILDHYYLLANLPKGFISNLQLMHIFIIAMILILISLSWMIPFLKKNWPLVNRKGCPL